MDPGALQSYVRFMRERLFDHIDIPPGAWHVPDGTLPAEVRSKLGAHEKGEANPAMAVSNRRLPSRQGHGLCTAQHANVPSYDPLASVCTRQHLKLPRVWIRACLPHASQGHACTRLPGCGSVLP
jgi:hypothetical protein